MPQDGVLRIWALYNKSEQKVTREGSTLAATTIRDSSNKRFSLLIAGGRLKIKTTGKSLRQAPPALSESGFGSAWFALCVAFALHIFDEAATGFLAVYNPTVTILRESWGWLPMGTIQLREFLIGHILVCLLLFCLTPLAARGMHGLRSLAWAYAVIMFLNALGHTVGTILGHTVASVTFSRPAPGFYTSPLLFLTSLWLMARLRRTARVEFQLPAGV